ncbi:U4/U6 small nuclear ribonucleoprotein Prp31-like [Trifolium pratense]|uniref:U4/U6 small nuclear ribonucleoprotein Prp31-like n=1 Tax=Trifolium pratense TaxID=57577 RepID=A0A2K3JW32_TRIPR|nr:U4/U6 small nuclear ribonucleoprotein Prp31-like [Trifolium pratense]
MTGNQMNLTLVDLQGNFPSAIIMVVSITTLATSCLIRKQLPEQVFRKTIEACDRALALVLDLAKKKVLDSLTRWIQMMSSQEDPDFYLQHSGI